VWVTVNRETEPGELFRDILHERPMGPAAGQAWTETIQVANSLREGIMSCVHQALLDVSDFAAGL
jgi:hypothetical protein